MCKRIITSFLILAFINLLYGCYSQEKAFKEELVVNEEKIMKVVYPDGNVVEFSEQGATYDTIESGIMGISLKGKRIAMSINNIKEIRLNEATSISLSEVEDQIISEVIINPNILYKFNEAGGTYNSKKNKIQGVLLNNQSVSFKPEQIKEIHLGFPKTISATDIEKNDNLKYYSI